MKRKLRIGIIGCGAIAQELHIPEYLDSGEAEIIALSDTDLKKAQAANERYSLNAQLFPSYKDMQKSRP